MKWPFQRSPVTAGQKAWLLVAGMFGMLAVWSWLDDQSTLERARFQIVQMKLAEAAYLASAELMSQGDLRQLEALEGGNPFFLLSLKPDSYQGEVTANEQVEGGYWAFNTTTGMAGYRIENSLSFEKVPEDNLVLFRLQLNHMDLDHDGQRDDSEPATSLWLERIN